jgi:hypothetical protein
MARIMICGMRRKRRWSAAEIRIIENKIWHILRRDGA